MDKSVKTKKEVLNRIKQDYYFTGILSKKGVFNFYIELSKLL